MTEYPVYQWIWRQLPGPTAARVVQAVLLVAAVVVILLFGVFPWAEPYLPTTGVTVGG